MLPSHGSDLPLPCQRRATRAGSAPPCGLRTAALCSALCGALATVLAAEPCAAQETRSDSAAARDSTRRVGQTLPGVTVTARVARPAAQGYQGRRTSSATRTDTPLLDVPQSVSVVTRQLIADQGMQGMADVVRYVPGVTMGQGEGNRDQPTIRGNASNADFFADGVRDDVEYFRDLYNVERVEVLKGPNAMIFGRGGGGGVINRVIKTAGWAPVRSVTLQGGSFDQRRAAVDLGQGVNEALALRLNGAYERSDSFRDDVALTRYGVNPTLSLAPREGSRVRLGYERFVDHRTADRGVPSFAGRPVASDAATFFGDPSQSFSDAKVHAVTSTVEQELGPRASLRNATRYADYRKFYQNVFPGAVDESGTQVSISAYNNRLRRRNLLNQTDATYALHAGALRHLLLGGVELSRQWTDAFRNTGYFGGTSTSLPAPVASPTVHAPVTFRQSATDADGHTTATVAAAYVQDQLELSPRLQAIAGVRYDAFSLDYRNDRTGARLSRTDRLLSPRLGLVLKPAATASLYGSYGVSYLPGSGNQFTSLTVTTRTLEPEQFTNYEVGAKWDAAPALSLTAAVYRLERTNTTAPDPRDATRLVQTGRQRSDGVELSATGSISARWQLAAGYGWQDVRITSTTAAAAAGATVPLTPRHSLSLWSRHQATRALGVGLGVVARSRAFAAIDDRVTLPGFARADAALFWTASGRVRAQLNVENLLDRAYYPTANSNNNISPGSPRVVRATLTTMF